MKARLEQEEIVGRPLSPQTEVMYELGKKIVEESITVGRDFASLMVKYSISAIPAYVGLLSLFQESFPNILVQSRLLFTLPVVFFLASCISFITSYSPRTKKLSIEIIDEIGSCYKDILRRRRLWNTLGTILFLVGVAVAVYTILFLLI